MVKKWPFFYVFFLGNIGQEKAFYNILERKNAVLAHKKENSKSRKIEIFPKGLTHGFGQKMAIFPCLFFRQYRPRKFVLQYSRTKNVSLAYKKKEFLKVEKLRFFQKVMPWFWSKKWPFFHVFFLGNIGQENVFYNFLEQKNAF